MGERYKTLYTRVKRFEANQNNRFIVRPGIKAIVLFALSSSLTEVKLVNAGEADILVT